MLYAVYQQFKDDSYATLCAVFLMKNEAEEYMESISSGDDRFTTTHIKEIHGLWGEWSAFREELM